MEKLKITTLSHVNTREGPGMIYSIKNKYPMNKTLISIDRKKDANGTTWFKLEEGDWICGNYVTLARDKQRASPLLATKAMNSILPDENNDRSIIPDIDGTFGTNNPTINDTVDVTSIIQKNQKIKNIIQTVKDRYGGKDDMWLRKRIFGTPYQFLPTTDRPRGKDAKIDQELGFTYYDALSEAAVLSILPGTPMFLPDLNGEEKSRIFNTLQTYASKMANSAGGLLDGDNLDVRYFVFNPNFTDYIRYVNTLCNALAVMYDIKDMQLPGMKDPLGKCNWAEYTMSMYYANRSSGVTSATGLIDKADDAIDKAINGAKSAWDTFWKDGIGAAIDAGSNAISAVVSDMGLAPYYTDFYVDPRVSYSETFTNVTRESMMASLVKGASDMAKEVSFLLDSGAISAVGNSQDNLMKELGKAAGNISNNGKGFFDRFFRGASTILTGANIVFPEIWTDSKYTKNYSVEIHLKTPYGRKKSIFTDIMVPLMHLVALVAPRQNTTNTFTSPFLVRCHIPGIFNVDLGIVESMTINKGGDGSAWNVEGLPTQVDVTLNIKDLYSSLSISRVNSVTDAYNLLWNNELISYLGIQSGIDMKHSNFAKMLNIANSLGRQAVEDIWERPYDRITEALSSMFGSWVKR